jgi:iron(III) transport system ATP-binding protein
MVVPFLPSVPILKLDAVTRQFSLNAPPAVRAASLAMQPGDLLSLLGPSGCGKTTLLRLIAGFEQPQTGTIEIAEQMVAGAGQWVPPEKRGVGMVFQDYALFPHLTVSQNIAFGLQHKPSAMIQQRVRETMTLVGLEGLADRYPHQISGGQQQRVALARALAPHPFLVLLDEPLSNLDVQVRLRLRQELREILKAAGTSAVLVTHDQEEALSISDQVAVMRQGSLEQIGTPETLYRAPTSRFVAEFVTQANFLPAQRLGPDWQTELGLIAGHRVVAARPKLNLLALESVDLMVRQEDVLMQTERSESHACEGTVYDRQFLGREYRYGVQLASGQRLAVRTSVDFCLPVQSMVQVALAEGAVLRAFLRAEGEGI